MSRFERVLDFLDVNENVEKNPGIESSIQPVNRPAGPTFGGRLMTRRFEDFSDVFFDMEEEIIIIN